MSSALADDAIVALYWERNEAAIVESDRKYGAYCQTIAQNILFNEQDALECVNDTWLGAWNSMPPHRPSVLASFLGKITRRLSISRFRKRTAEKRGEGELPLALDELEECVSHGSQNGSEVESMILQEELTRIIEGFLKAQPQAQRSMFVCRYWYLDPVAEIAARFGCSESKVKTTLFRMRERLKGVLEQEGYLG